MVGYQSLQLHDFIVLIEHYIKRLFPWRVGNSAIYSPLPQLQLTSTSQSATQYFAVRMELPYDIDSLPNPHPARKILYKYYEYYRFRQDFTPVSTANRLDWGPSLPAEMVMANVLVKLDRIAVVEGIPKLREFVELEATRIDWKILDGVGVPHDGYWGKLGSWDEYPGFGKFREECHDRIRARERGEADADAKKTRAQKNMIEVSGRSSLALWLVSRKKY